MTPPRSWRVGTVGRSQSAREQLVLDLAELAAFDRVIPLEVERAHVAQTAPFHDPS